ncbi:phosphomannomutase/phosphoglucomutase [Candidatus Nitronereus thalassa]|uniref:Phosphomannomutase/phosphoglucomutase n=1 Tax=Candidatus Nitronereus thalassa TaxID=3020898 RepID=A0ABU3K4G9_9BACT|nr:phosphomannomutase/phosphoglucomutase [Candidatus Nitronereus thalassa]MDT7041263.1 phosphomannomutase/phosphoglucomutase [Candidatus Nitronereus thalassa]
MSIFREYDIRGIVGKDLTVEIAESIGRGYATLALSRGCKTVAVGRDGRLTSPELRDRFVAGVISTGMNVVDIGVCATPLLYFSLFNLPVDGGVMITGSHNAAEYNGFKMCVGKGALYGEGIQQLKKILDEGSYATGTGAVSESPVIPEYMAYLKENFSKVDGSGLHVVIDAGNGAASLVAKDALEQMGCKVTPLFCDLDGRFPNHHPDPTVVENLQDLIRTVKDQGADVGIGYDGDADRIGAIDEKSNILWGDRLMLIFARDILESQPGSTFISEVKASQLLYDDIEKRGGRGIMWKTGHSVLKAKMKEEKAVLAGEMSGHMFFADRYFGYDDAIYASCRLIEILAKKRKPLSSLLADLPITEVTPEIRVDCSDDVKFTLVEKVRNRFLSLHKNPDPTKPQLIVRDVVTIDGIRVRFDDGWGLIRASNTQPALVLRFEANSLDRLNTIRTYLEGELDTCQRALEP